MLGASIPKGGRSVILGEGLLIINGLVLMIFLQKNS